MSETTLFTRENYRLWCCRESGNSQLLRRGKVLIVSTILSLLSGCVTVKDTRYERPVVPAKEEWVAADHKPNVEDVVQRQWWQEFNDEYLNQLIAQAIKGDFGLRVLAARIEVARAAARLEKSDALPKLNLNASANLSHSVESGSTTFYSADMSASWEVDVWGRVRRGVRAKESEFRATEADWRAGYLTLVSDVASRYFEIRKLDQQLQYQQYAISMNRNILDIYTNQYREGLIAKSRLLQHQAELKDLYTVLLEQQRQRKVAENRLATLLGVPAGELNVANLTKNDEIRIPEVPLGLPSDLLSRRPDIVAQEHRVLAAHHLLGQARLAQLPRFSLTGSGSVGSSVLSGLLKSWSLGLVPAISIPIFDPSIKPNIRSNEAQTRVAEEQYRQAVMNAFEEVESTLVNLASRKKQQEQVMQQLAYLKQVNRNVHVQLKEGMVSQLEVFESERSLLSAQLSELELNELILTDTVALYKALGGGWSNQDLILLAKDK